MQHNPGSTDRPLLHIGYHKTATSWFQKNLYSRVRNASYLPRPLVRDAFLNTTAWRFDAAQARLDLHSELRPIVCEEDLCGYPENGGLLEALSWDVARRLRETFPDADIVIFIRSQLDMIRSTYLQYVRSGGTRSLRRYLQPYPPGSTHRRRWYKNPLLTLDHFAYQHLIRRYRELFGKDRVHIFCYEQFTADPAVFVERFVRRFELDVDINTLNFARRNESLGWMTLKLSRWLGPFTRWETINRLKILPVLPKWLPKAGLKALNKTPLSGPAISTQRLFGKSLERELAQRFAADNQVLLEEVGPALPLREFGYPLP